MSYPTAVIKCSNCKKHGTIEVFGPTKEVELPSGWLFMIKMRGVWNKMQKLTSTWAFTYTEDVRVVCSPTCASAFVEKEIRK